MARLDATTWRQSANRIRGDQLFQLHDTYGCPPDLIADILRENADKGWAWPTARWPSTKR